MGDFAPAAIALGACVALITLLVGFLVGRSAKSKLRQEADSLGSELSRCELQVREQSRVVARMRNEQRYLTNLFRDLPNLVRELNSSDLEREDIPRHLFKLVRSIFEPKQILLFLVRAPGEEAERVHEVYLRHQVNAGEIPPAATRIPVGEGKIGWVAENKVEMLADDWLNLSRTEGRTIEDNHPAFRTDLVGPLVHHGTSRESLIGVLCIGEPAVHPRDERLMLQMITNLGSIAYRNVRNVRLLSLQANHDGLTGLLNKRHFLKIAGELIFEAGRRAQPLGLFMFDIDHFKAYNDNNGHLAGDEVLKGVASVLRENIRPEDVAARYGGEEFVVAMPLTEAHVALAVAERIRQAIASHPFDHCESQPGHGLTISGGVAAFPQDGTTCTDLIGAADKGLYEAKTAGRNRIVQHKGIILGDADDGAVQSEGETSEAASGLEQPVL